MIDSAVQGKAEAMRARKSPCEELDEGVVDLSRQGEGNRVGSMAAKSPRPARLHDGTALPCSAGVDLGEQSGSTKRSPGGPDCAARCMVEKPGRSIAVRTEKQNKQAGARRP